MFKMRELISPRQSSLLNMAIAIPAIVSLSVGIRNGLRRSQDFQWSGSHLLGLHVDPYLQHLRHDPEHRILMSQVPNYLHLLYVLMLPLGVLPFGVARDVWVVINVVLTIVCVVLLGKVYQLERSRTVLLGFLLLLSTPFRVMLGNGQQGMLETLLLVLLLTSIRGRGFILGLSYFKYSFSPLFVFYYAFRGRWRLLLASLIPPMIGLSLFWSIVHGRLLTVGLEPFAVSHTGGVSPGMGDLMTLGMQLSQHFAADKSNTAGMILALLGSVLVGWLVARRRPTDADAFATLAPASLLMLIHLSYDFVLLVIPLAALLGRTDRSDWSRAYGLALIGLLWYCMPDLSRIWPNLSTFWLLVTSCLLLTLCVFYNLPQSRTSSLVTADR